MKRNLWQEPRVRGDCVGGGDLLLDFSRASVKAWVLGGMGGGESLDEIS